MGFIISTVGVVFAFGLVVFIHEMGHFIVAKKSGVKVDAFAFGFGKEIYGFQRGETRYSVNWIPLGGYVKMAGEVSEDYEGPVLEGKPTSENVDRSREFLGQPWYRRILIALAGPFMNYVLAILIFFLMFMIWGQPVQTNKTEIGKVMVGMPAEKAGIQSGDSILLINDEPIADWGALAEAISKRPDQPLEILIQREDQEVKVNVVPKFDEKLKRGLIGIQPAQPQVDFSSIGLIEAGQKAIHRCWFITSYSLVHLGKKIWAREKPDVAGPIGIINEIGKAARSGMFDFIGLVGIISVAIGLFNLFPIPLLDGGHIVYYLIEGIRGKPLSARVMGKANVVGMALLLSLVVFATFNDFQRIWPKKDKPAVEQKK